MAHYWPLSNQTLKDEIGQNDLTQRNLTSFTSDRFGNAKSALALNGGWTQVTSGIYFDTYEFSISVWVYPQSLVSNERIIDFSNGPSTDNLELILISRNNKLIPRFSIFDNSSNSQVLLESSLDLTLNKWHFLSVTFNESSLRIYVNGNLTGIATFNKILPNSLTTSQNYFGKSSYIWLDEIRFFSKSLKQNEIILLMNDSYCEETTTVAPPLKNVNLTLV